MSIYRRALAYYRPFLAPTLGATALTLGAVAFNLLRPQPFMFLIDHVLPGGKKIDQPPIFLGFDFTSFDTTTRVFILCALIVVFHLLAGVINLAATLIFVRVGLQALLRLRTELYAYLHALPLKFHDARRSADSSFRVAYDSQSIQTFYARPPIFSAAIARQHLRRHGRLIGARCSRCSSSRSWSSRFIFAKRIREQSTTIAEHEVPCSAGTGVSAD